MSAKTIQEEAAEWIVDLLSGNGFGDDYTDEELATWSQEILSSRLVKRLQSAAWIEGVRLFDEAAEHVITNPYQEGSDAAVPSDRRD